MPYKYLYTQIGLFKQNSRGKVSFYIVGTTVSSLPQ